MRGSQGKDSFSGFERDNYLLAVDMAQVFCGEPFARLPKSEKVPKKKIRKAFGLTPSEFQEDYKMLHFECGDKSKEEEEKQIAERRKELLKANKNSRRNQKIANIVNKRDSYLDESNKILSEDKIETIKAEAEKGSPLHIVALGLAYETGTHVKRDLKKAFSLYIKAVKKKYHEGFFALGWLYENGLGVKKNPAYAIKLYKRAIKYDNPNAKKRLEEIETDKGSPKDKTAR